MTSQLETAEQRIKRRGELVNEVKRIGAELALTNSCEVKIEYRIRPDGGAGGVVLRIRWDDGPESDPR